MNKHKIKAGKLATNHYTRLSSGQMVLIQDYKERIEGVVEEADKSLENTKRATAVFLHGCFVATVVECLRLTIGKWDQPGRKRSTKSGYAENVLLRESLILHSERLHRHFFMKKSVMDCLLRT